MLSSAMNFPHWDLGGINSGLLIAVIAATHVFVAQFAVGGGFFLVMAEYKGHREGSRHILAWVQRHTRFFLLLTMVVGSMTGVGIWLAISLTAPAGTSLLIREFVYAWAAEWVFFLAEILTLLLYAASFPRTLKGQMPVRDHLLLGVWYAVFAFLSLCVINGIISFMLTPGMWLQNGSFWSAFFNPTYWPALLFRFGLSLCLAGMFGLITTGAIKHEETRENMVRFCARWICLPFVLMLLGSIWYVAALPEDIRALMQRTTDDIRPFVRSFLYVSPVLFLAGMFLFIRLPRKAYPPYVAVVLVLGLISAGSFEFIRESARRPWLIHGHMYSNGITVQDGQRINAEGILATSGWARLRGGLSDAAAPNLALAKPSAAPVAHDSGQAPALLASLSPSGRAQFGRFIYVQQCSSCHGLGGPRLDLLPRVKDRGVQGVAALLAAQGIISPYMPPFFGTAEERLFFAQWLVGLEALPRE
jgi:mono/diheme cytochrome c family protein